MELIFLDPGLIGKGGHSYNLAKIIGETLSRRNIPHRVFGMRALDPPIAAELGATPHFSRSLYECAELSPLAQGLQRLAAVLRLRDGLSSPHSEPRTWKLINEAFEDDLARLPQEIWDPANVVALPAITQNQLAGLVRFLRAKRRRAIAPVVCHLMFPPTYVPWAQVSRLGANYYRQAFALAEEMTGRSLFFTTENKAMQALFRREFGVSTKILPLPFGAPLAARERPHDGKVRLGFLGDSRCDKGFHLLPEAIALCQAATSDAEFLVQIHHGGWEQRAVAAERALRTFRGVRLAEGVLTAGGYQDLMREADIMLLPYDPQIFGLRGSGVFTEAVAAGLPLIASEGTFAAASIESEDAEGEIFAPYTGEALAGAILRLLARLASAQAQAKARALAFARAHSGEAFADVLLAHAR